MASSCHGGALRIGPSRNALSAPPFTGINFGYMTVTYDCIDTRTPTKNNTDSILTGIRTLHKQPQWKNGQPDRFVLHYFTRRQTTIATSERIAETQYAIHGTMCPWMCPYTLSTQRRESKKSTIPRIWRSSLTDVTSIKLPHSCMKSTFRHDAQSALKFGNHQE